MFPHWSRNFSSSDSLSLLRTKRQWRILFIFVILFMAKAACRVKIGVDIRTAHLRQHLDVSCFYSAEGSVGVKSGGFPQHKKKNPQIRNVEKKVAIFVFCLFFYLDFGTDMLLSSPVATAEWRCWSFW